MKIPAGAGRRNAMELLPFDKVAYEALNHYCNKLENHLKSDVFFVLWWNSP